VRIVGGLAKGRRLAAPASATRPTSDRVRESLFNALESRIALSGARVLDLFAGTGAVGLEALSRGAARVVLIDQSRAAVEVIRENARLLAGGGGDVQIHQQDARIALAALADAGVRFDVVYLDPPYASPLYEPLLEESGRLLEETGTVVAEHFHKRALPETIGGLVSTRSVRIGDHKLTFYEARHD